MEHSREDYGDTYAPFEARPTRSSTIIAVIAGITLAGAAVVWATGAAWGHQAPTTVNMPLGWTYSASCCSGRDCAQLPEGAVREGPDGYEITIRPGEHPMVVKETFRTVIPYNDRRLRDSPDGLYHGCLTPSLTFLCLYRGSRGF